LGEKKKVFDKNRLEWRGGNKSAKKTKTLRIS